LDSTGTLESVLVGYFDGSTFRFAAKIEVYLSGRQSREFLNGAILFRVSESPFVQVPGKMPGDTWKSGITKEDRSRCIWLRPAMVADVEFLEWTEAACLRHARVKRIVRVDV
jgi:hypothetical protein